MSSLHTPEEQSAMDAIIEAMKAIQNLDPRCNLRYNVPELCGAIHVLQSFVKQHVLWRLDPDWYSDWWADDGHGEDDYGTERN